MGACRGFSETEHLYITIIYMFSLSVVSFFDLFCYHFSKVLIMTKEHIIVRREPGGTERWVNLYRNLSSTFKYAGFSR